MWTRRIQIAYPVVVCLFSCLLGCSKDPGPQLAVNGRVQYRGTAVQGGTIVFVPDTSRGEHGKIAFGKIRPDGSYSLKTEKGDGASAGYYKVSVVSVTAPIAQASQSFQFPQSNLPEKYRDPDLSMLVCEVKPHQTNTIDFNLD